MAILEITGNYLTVSDKMYFIKSAFPIFKRILSREDYKSLIVLAEYQTLFTESLAVRMYTHV